MCLDNWGKQLWNVRSWDGLQIDFTVLTTMLIIKNLVVSMNRKAKQTFFHDSIPISSTFCKACKPMFFNKSDAMHQHLRLIDNDVLINNRLRHSEHFQWLLPFWNNEVEETPDAVLSAISQIVNLSICCLLLQRYLKESWSTKSQKKLAKRLVASRSCLCYLLFLKLSVIWIFIVITKLVRNGKTHTLTVLVWGSIKGVVHRGVLGMAHTTGYISIWN